MTHRGLSARAAPACPRCVGTAADFAQANRSAASTTTSRSPVHSIDDTLYNVDLLVATTEYLLDDL